MTAQPQTAKKPDIVLIMSDQHNASIMGCAGNEIIKTPNLDKLAENGIRLTDFNCPSPLCAPSRMGFMSAQYPSDVDVFDNGSQLSSSVPTFAHALSSSGYETVLCGRMHFSEPAQCYGFDNHLVGGCQHGSLLSPEIHGSGYNRTDGQTKYAVEVSGYGRTGYQAYDRAVTQAACEFIRCRRDNDRPYVLVVGLISPHNPLICSKEWFDYYLEKIPAPESLPQEYLNNLHPAIKKWRERRGCNELTAKQNHRGLAAYYGLISELDANVGKIVNEVNSSALADNTITIYTSDHGDMAYEHGMWWKTTMYNGAVRIPGIFSWPGRFPKNDTLDAVLSLIDLGPTVLDLTASQELSSVSGRSFARLLSGEDKSEAWDNQVFAECLGDWGDQPSFMVRQGSWKLIYYHEFKSYQLFNLQDDPDEMNDLSDDPACREVTAQCLEKMRLRWSPEEILTRVAKQRLQNLSPQKGDHGVCMQWKAPAEDNEFDFRQLE